MVAMIHPLVALVLGKTGRPDHVLANGAADANHGSPEKCDEPMFQWFLHDNNVTTILDVGGGDGKKGDIIEASSPSLRYDCVDLGKYGRCKAFDGEKFAAYANNSRDVVMFLYVLHHAGHHTPSLLAEASRVARKYVLVLDDLRGDSQAMLDRQAIHKGCTSGSGSTLDGCVFRTDDEYRQVLFPAAGLQLVHAGDPESLRHCMPHDWYQIQRGFYVLRPNGARPVYHIA